LQIITDSCRRSGRSLRLRAASRPFRRLRGFSRFARQRFFPRAFLHLADKAKPLAGKRADQHLPLAVVADGVANRVDLAAERGL
jgi:hypothetical protein